MVLHPNEFLDGSREDVCEPKERPLHHFLPWALTASHWSVPEASVEDESLKTHLENPREMKIHARIFFFFYALPIIVQWTWSEKLVTISFLLKWTLLPFLLSVWKAGMPFPWWGILAPPCGIQPEFRGGGLHPCRGPRRDAQVHIALLPDRTVHISGEKQSGWRWGGKQIFGHFFFFLSSDHASVLKISPVHFQTLSSLLSSVVVW